MMQPFQYHRPSTLAEAKRLLASQPEASFVAGGHTLLPIMKQGLTRPAALVDLGRISELRGIRDEDGRIAVGAITCHAELASSALVRERIPSLTGLAASIGDRHVRNRGTMGGSLANNDPAADYPAAVLGLGATVVTDRRDISAEDFFVSLYETALEPDEIITRIVFPVPQLAAYAKIRSSASRFAIVGVFIARTADGVRVSVTGAGASGVFRARELEFALQNDFRVEALGNMSIDPGGMLEDMNATKEYRAHLVMVMARRALRNPGCALSFK